MDNVINNRYSFNIYINPSNNEPVEYAPLALEMYQDMTANNYDTMSEILVQYYAKRNKYTNIRQKSSDLRKLVFLYLRVLPDRFYTDFS